MKATDRPKSAPDRVIRALLGTSRALVIYGLLLGGSLVFTLPFVWMLGTSFKVDREMFSAKMTIWPQRPLPAETSPYLDARYFKPPRDTDYERVRATIEKALLSGAWSAPPDVANREQAVEILTPGVFKKLKDITPVGAWALPDTELRDLVRQRVTRDLTAEVARKVSRGLLLGTVRVRSFELQEHDVTADRPVSEFWQPGGGSAAARLVDLEESKTPQAVLHYDYGEGDSDVVRLVSDMVLPFQADRLFRTQVSVRPDDSWHRMEFYLEKNGKRYHGIRPQFMGDFQPMVVSLQEYGPDDLPDANKIKLWIAYKEVDEGPQYESRPNRVKLELELHRNGQGGAWWAKCQRNYRDALSYIPFWRYFSTSVLLVLLNIMGNVLSCSLVAYAFARLRWPGRDLCFALMMATLMIPPQVTMIPYFLIIKHLGWYNTLTPLWFISFFGNAFNVFLLRQFMKGIPRDLEDAAKIDGCNVLQVYWYVMMPLIKPTLACIAIFTFMGVWNDFMGPLIFLADQRLYPLSLGLYALNVQQEGNFGMLMAGSLLMTLPVIIIFFFAQRYFIQGITLTGTKG